ncbi:MAG: DUF6477 family protein [Roseinatronobacter sp.]
MFINGSNLETLIRPRLLVVSARHALRDYDRAARLPRLLRQAVSQPLPTPEIALRNLLTYERTLEQARKSHDCRWSAAEHVAVMTALLHEFSLCAVPTSRSVPAHEELAGTADHHRSCSASRASCTAAKAVSSTASPAVA